MVRDPSVGTSIAPSTEYKCIKYNTNKLTLKLTTNPNQNRSEWHHTLCAL